MVGILTKIYFSYYSLGMKDSWGPMKALAVASVINGIGDVVLCLFLGYGIAGAAWATMVSQVCCMIFFSKCILELSYEFVSHFKHIL